MTEKKEYIERGALRKKIFPYEGIDKAKYAINAKAVEAAINGTPTADVVEVVRCKDCKYGRPIDKTKEPEKYFKGDCIVCECWNVVGDKPTIYIPHHFCSYGEREERG